jgi:hypothetical protein
MVSARIIIVCLIVVMAALSAEVCSSASDAVRISRVFIDSDSKSMVISASLEPFKSFSDSRVEFFIPETGKIGSADVELSAGEGKSVRVIVPVQDIFEYVKVVFTGNNERTVKYVPIQ